MCTSKPKVPKPEPVIQRQAYSLPKPRGSESSSAGDAARRRRLMGVATSSQGILDPASTTRSVLGGEAIQPSIGGGGGASVVAAAPASTKGGGPVDGGPTTVPRGPRTGTAGGGKTKSTLGFRPNDAWVGQFLRRQPLAF